MKCAFFLALLLAQVCVQAQGAYAACPTGVFFKFQLDEQAHFIADSTLTVQPTEGMRNSANVVQFVVDTIGKIAPGSFRVMKVTDHAVVQDAKQMSERWRFKPARSAGRAVCELVQSSIASVSSP